MPRPTVIARPQRLPRATRRRLPIKAVAKTYVSDDNPSQSVSIDRYIDLGSLSSSFQVDPYLDYGRYLTDEGGILFVYKDVDLRFRHTVWRFATWALFTGFEIFCLTPYLPLEKYWIKIVLLLIAALANRIIVDHPVEMYCGIEIRPDCMIVGGSEIFWARFMEVGHPSFRPGADGTQILCGIYGTRFVEYLAVRRFDDHDRMVEVLAAHLADAMRQQWSRPST